MTTRTPLRLLVVDDHEVVREGLIAVLEADARFDVSAVAIAGAEALRMAEEVRPDVAIVDLRLPDMSGESLCRRIHESFPSTVVIVLSSYFTEESVRGALKAGAHAYVTKAAGLGELRSILERVHDDPGDREGVRSASQIVRHLERLVEQRMDDMPTDQQTRILRLVAEGLTRRQVARRLEISESTVRFHLQNLKLKLNVKSVAELVATAASKGYLSPEEATDQVVEP